MALVGVFTALGLGAVASPAAAANAPDCNWGGLTAGAIAEGFDQGGHASQQANPRVGLANVVERGNLQATCQLIEGLL
jgi:hypothetical protein